MYYYKNKKKKIISKSLPIEESEHALNQMMYFEFEHVDNAQILDLKKEMPKTQFLASCHLTDEEENTIVKWIEEATEIGETITTLDVRNKATDLARKRTPNGNQSK